MILCVRILSLFLIHPSSVVTFHNNLNTTFIYCKTMVTASLTIVADSASTTNTNHKAPPEVNSYCRFYNPYFPSFRAVCCLPTFYIYKIAHLHFAIYLKIHNLSTEYKKTQYTLLNQLLFSYIVNFGCVPYMLECIIMCCT